MDGPLQSQVFSLLSDLLPSSKDVGFLYEEEWVRKLRAARLHDGLRDELNPERTTWMRDSSNTFAPLLRLEGSTVYKCEKECWCLTTLCHNEDD